MDYADSAFELKALDDAGNIEGLAAGIGDVDRGGDRIMPGAFTKSLADRGGRALPMLVHHDLARPIGAWREWNETRDGLYVKGRVTLATRDGQEAYALARDGALTGLSIGWLPKGRPAFEGGVRVLAELDLFETSLVAVPMHDRARVASVKAITSAGDIAELLRERGISGRQAKAAAGFAWKAINDSSSEPEADAALVQLFEEHAARLAAAGAR